MSNQASHKRTAEELLKSIPHDVGVLEEKLKNNSTAALTAFGAILDLAHIHAILATVPDRIEAEEAMNGPVRRPAPYPSRPVPRTEAQSIAEARAKGTPVDFTAPDDDNWCGDGTIPNNPTRR